MAKCECKRLHMLDCQINALNVGKLGIWQKIVRGRMRHMGIVMKNLRKRGLPKERRIGLW